MNELTAVFAILGETYFKLRMTQDQLESLQQERAIFDNEMRDSMREEEEAGVNNA